MSDLSCYSTGIKERAVSMRFIFPLKKQSSWGAYCLGKLKPSHSQLQVEGNAKETKCLYKLHFIKHTILHDFLPFPCAHLKASGVLWLNATIYLYSPPDHPMV